MSLHPSILAAAQPDGNDRAALPVRLAACGALAAAIPAALLGSEQIAAFSLAAVGAAALTGTALGLVRFRQGSPADGKGFAVDLETLPAAYALGDERGRLISCNAPFRAALGLAECPRNVSDIAGRDNELSAAFFRLLAATRHAQSAAQIVRLGGPVADARNLEIAVHVYPGAANRRSGKGRTLLWTLAAVSDAAQPGSDRPQGLAVQLMLDALPLAAFLFDARGQIVASNSAFKSMAGVPERERLSGSVTDYLLREDGQPFKSLQWRHFTARGGNSGKTVSFRRKSLSRQCFSAHFSQPHKDARVHSAWTLCVLTPLPVAAGADDANFGDLLAAAPVAIATAKRDGAILSANRAFETMFACAQTSEGGPHMASLVEAESREALSSALRQAGEAEQTHAGDPVSLEVRFGPEGRRRAQLFLKAAARPGQITVYGIDTTAQHALEEQVAHSQKMQAMGQLAGGIAHDFNNVLTAIIGFSDLLLARFRRSDPAFQDVMNIKNSANRAAELVRQLLAYSRRQTLRPRVLSLTDVIEDFNSSLGRLLGEKVKARIVHGRDLWYVKADESQLFQVIMNLAVNARDAMPGGGLLTIRTQNVTERESLALKDHGIERGEYVLWEISDTGTGIPPETLKKIFDPFFTTKEVGKGTGLGLSTVDGIIKQTGGSIVVDSKLGEGTAFRIYLPRYQEAEEDIRAAQASRKSETAAADLTGSATVLLVEDEDAVRSFASRALTARGYQVLEAASGAEALEVMDRQMGAIDLVVSDVVMPEMDGPTLLGHLRKKKPDIKIVFMSGYAEEAFRKNLSEDEKFIFLPKPFTLKKLAETIKEATAA